MSFAIIDSGSTKADWRIVSAEGTYSIRTIGLNPYFISESQITSCISEEVLPSLKEDTIEEIFFYGAGCGTDLRKQIIMKAFSKSFPKSSINVDTDLNGAAIALLGDQTGMAVILGTGTSTGIYNGKTIIKSIDSLGYILGDEGSGAAIGRKMVRDFLRNYFPSELQEQFKEEFPFNRDAVLGQLYNQPFPSRFLAQWVPFAARHVEHEYIQRIIEEAFSELFQNIILHYEGFRSYSFNCCGSVGYVFREILEKIVSRNGMMTGRIISSPLDDLVLWHKARL